MNGPARLALNTGSMKSSGRTRCGAMRLSTRRSRKECCTNPNL